MDVDSEGFETCQNPHLENFIISLIYCLSIHNDTQDLSRGVLFNFPEIKIPYLTSNTIAVTLSLPPARLAASIRDSTFCCGPPSRANILAISAEGIISYSPSEQIRYCASV